MVELEIIHYFLYVQMMILKHVPAEIEAAEGDLTEEEKKKLKEMEMYETAKGGTK